MTIEKEGSRSVSPKRRGEISPPDTVTPRSPTPPSSRTPVPRTYSTALRSSTPRFPSGYSASVSRIPSSTPCDPVSPRLHVPILRNLTPRRPFSYSEGCQFTEQNPLEIERLREFEAKRMWETERQNKEYDEKIEFVSTLARLARSIFSKLSCSDQSTSGKVSKLETIVESIANPSSSELNTLFIEAKELAKGVFVDVLKKVPGMELCNELINIASECDINIFISTLTLVDTYGYKIAALLKGYDYCLMLSIPDEKFARGLLRPTYVFTTDKMFYCSSCKVEEIKITTEKLTELKGSLEITDNDRDEKPKELSYKQLQNIILISDHALLKVALLEVGEQLANYLFKCILDHFSQEKPGMGLIDFVNKCRKCTLADKEAREFADDMFTRILKPSVALIDLVYRYELASEVYTLILKPSVELIDLVDRWYLECKLTEDARKFANEIFMRILNTLETSADKEPNIELAHLVYRCLICTSTNEKTKRYANELFMGVLNALVVVGKTFSVDFSFVDRSILSEEVRRLIDSLFPPIPTTVAPRVEHPGEKPVTSLADAPHESSAVSITNQVPFDRFLRIITAPIRLLGRACSAISDFFANIKKTFVEEKLSDNLISSNLDSPQKPHFIGCGWISICKSIILEHKPSEATKKDNYVASTLPPSELRSNGVSPENCKQVKEEISAFPSSRCRSFY